MFATKEKVRAINAILAKRGLMDDKKNLISSFSDGRTDRSSLLTESEAAELISLLNRDQVPSIEDLRKERMARKILAMAHELGWIKKANVVTAHGIKDKRDYTALTNWMTKFSYLHKPLSQYKYDELPKLVTQFENGPYKDYLSKR